MVGCDVAVTDDRFLGDALAILQPAAGYRAGLDAILLAAACPGVAGWDGLASQNLLARKNAIPASPDAKPSRLQVLDIGAGVGVAGLAVAARLRAADVTLVERDPLTASLAESNVARNGFQGRARVVLADVTARLDADQRAALGRECYDVVIANPPYHDDDRGRLAADPLKRASHTMPAGDLVAWARFMARMARPGGRCVIIHRAEALGDIFVALGRRFGGLTVLPLHPRTNAPAIRVLVAGIKGSRAPLRLLSGLVLHGVDGRFSPGIEAVLRAPVPLPVDLCA